jgi:bacillolysin
MKFSLITTAILLAANLAFAGQDSQYSLTKERHSLETSDIPTYFEYSNEKRPQLSELKAQFQNYWKGIDGFDFVEIGQEVDQIGFVHFRYEQTYQGVPIEFAEWIVHTKNNEIYSMNGKLVDQIPGSIQNRLSKKAAFSAAKKFVGAKQYKWEIPAEEKHLKSETGNPFATYYPAAEMKYVGGNTILNSGDLKLTYKYNIYAQEPLSRQEVYVDAASGDVVFVNNLIHTANTSGTAQTAYSGTQIIKVDSLAPGSFRLRQTINGNGVNTYDLLRGTSYANSVDFTDADNNWNNVNTLRDEYATDAHWGAENTHEYFQVKFGRNSINNAGFALNSYLHYSVNYNNAFWDGQRMTYGDGSGTSTPLVALDIASHEITHGLTTFTANLIYANESGALNESFSDIFGAAVEFFARPNRANWLLGEDIGGAFRSLSNPRQYGDPDTYDGTNWRQTIGCAPTQQNDQCGVHSNSGVQNKWFYLLTVGGSGTNNAPTPQAYNVVGLGMDTAAAIAFRNLTIYLTQSSNFSDARFYSIQSAVDLYGACSPQHISVTNAWHAVGVGSAYTPGVSSNFVADLTQSCAPGLRTSFTNNSNNATNFTWNFGDGTFSTVRNPSHTYNSFGQYDVSLIANGGACGIDTILKAAFIDIDSTLACVVILDDGRNSVETECSGKIYDSGGANGNYSANENGVVTISPANAASITLTFPFFDIESGTGGTLCDYDVLRIFDGPTSSSALLGEYCNNNLPTSITSTRGNITIEFESDGGLEEAGFEIDWQCNYPTVSPATDFLVSELTTCDGEITFTDISTQLPTSRRWDFGDGNGSTLENPIHNYTANGTYSVKLVSTNAFGSDSLTKSNVVSVTRPNGPTIGNDTVCAGVTATLTASASGAVNWYANEFGGNSIGTGNSYSLPNLTANTQVWSQNLIAGAIQIVGPVANTIGGGANFNNFQYLIFDVLDKMELVSVLVYSGLAANRTIELRDANGVVLQSLSRFIPAGPFRVNLNMTIDPGTDYQLGVTAGTQPNLYRNNTGVSYPYTIANILSIKSSSAGTNPGGFYYFFYNWRVKSPDCVSPRTSVSAIIDSNCNVTSVKEVASNQAEIKIFPNPSDRSFTLEAINQTVTVLEVLDLSGKLMSAIQKNDFESKTLINTANWESGVYFIRISSDQGIKYKKVIVTH